MDVENLNPGQRPGQIHLHHGREKYLYDPGSNTFIDAPRTVNDMLKTPEMQKSIEKGLYFLGEK
jgi:filamentous hemagglutinin